MTGCSIQVARPGALTTIQDCGRPGYAHLGVPRSGALDAPAHHRANQLVGNPPGAPVLETTLTGVAVTARAAVTVAVTGAHAAVRLDGRRVGLGTAVAMAAGQTLDVGPARLAAGDVLDLGEAAAPDGPPAPGGGAAVPGGGAAAAGGGAAVPGGTLAAAGFPPRCPQAGVPAAPVPGERAELLIHLGPRDDWLSAVGLAALRGAAWKVSPQSNRVALRLAGAAPPRSRSGELPSEGLVAGAIEALPDGQLVVFLADHPTTGGYPVIAVLDPGSLPVCAQARPGLTVTFRIA
ncbi:MAG TPA: biotin-dependent carboxyltransferase family protein [Streptosporangiaceae bacterium]|nr:biotin-dependent carboxyltransferase family protein [Streptosporangiaceae bacterium]